MIKKSFGLFAIMGLSASLAACSGGGEEGTNEDGSVSIEFMHSQVEQDRITVINDIIEKFEKANPDIQVEPVPVEEDAYNTKIVTLASAGELPEVLEVGQDYARVMDKDQLIDKEAVQTVIDGVGAENFYEGALKLLGTEDGKSYTGMPINGWVQGIWYNKEMLEAEGFEEPTSWDQVMEVAEAFTDGGSKKYGIAMPTVEGGFSEQAFSQFALSNNANVLDGNGELAINTPEMKEALQFYKDLSQYTMPGSNDVTEVNDAFMNGSVPMAIYSTYILPGVFEQGNAEKIGFAIPENKTKAVFGSASALTVASGLEDAQKEAAQKFLTFMAEPENMTDWVLMSPGGAQPVSDLVTESEAYKSNEVVQAFGELSTEIASSFDDIQVFGLVDGKNFLKMGDISSSGEIPKMINGVTVGEQSVDDAIKTAESNLQKVLQ
ncbi:sugar ABC transporter substrate-binding protein [Planococcus sp. N028]|uniref:Sugar ABC transporter substrate-binding protein n=1 Tax=Planococcus shixiaomingii TaxID=3058393 RepID=A0ABT8N2R6_9BACL|nr:MULTISPECIES: sugar ABC transporter substrate-binding protein [unclassified Planococcus (in: firmicutes)]MDN7242187.1 sugar ABC transporter substrate-binding protein [Planococcus sp. N028]WKA54460.1 sugar ABC transporter substrate-binding protein [Planococcus sp. N022]